ncbi:uncharacterized protein OCT59_029216 [Rhizophagus irregularis]|nr:hypothetical protein GLOIN_2v1875301 [Rhizophagus irregularis DAOM 181602=DAOM 197198]EXX53834.1 hypothetical protein RirG_240260 [Rhizophagus irregularis DAOM 197198w]POG72303.1 hypothetical protein GLOIN_2v1875301 [Rhizophagus irregularis DAOM 181602=DAOM 197198]UZO08974.1 hypothetical protein OCT59_029216 [Rhizophagus irregularis]CAG8630093.1 21695_t:CDS:1 [Rhizophagus irregularis]|eukprot:XP_025179169.1 hypothetical protein GLOIN_2v1875301 [Rhizophagus irregularis DAOM 181602=DAOM 197198]
MEELTKGMRFIQIPLEAHRINALHQGLLPQDYKLDKLDDRYIMYYSEEVSYKNIRGVSCFVPSDTPHNVPAQSHEKLSCFFLSENTQLPSELIFIYTHKMSLRFPFGRRQNALHFLIAPTRRMTKEDYEQAVKNLNWNVCEMKVFAEVNKLVSLDEDLDDVEDFRMVELYWLMEYFYENKANLYMDRLHMIDFTTWIAQTKPKFDDLLNQEFRSYIVFNILLHMDSHTQSDLTTQTYIWDILGELNDVFKWNESNFLDDCLPDTTLRAQG